MQRKQINQAYAVLLSSHFQGFCRDLHSECIDFLAQAVTPVTLRTTLLYEFSFNRKLDKGNPNSSNIGSDFGRLGVSFWSAVEAHDGRNTRRKVLLEQLNEWRNAIAHQDFDPARLGGTMPLRLQHVLVWRNACVGLAASFDEIMRMYLQRIIGTSPW
jgi:hypothetical protein